jgi:hypothetical protein
MGNQGFQLGDRTSIYCGGADLTETGSLFLGLAHLRLVLSRVCRFVLAIGSRNLAKNDADDYTSQAYKNLDLTP